MNKELNKQIETLMADFNKRQEEICNEISNLEKSTNAIKDSILKEWEVVEKAIIEDIRYATVVIYNITKNDSNSFTSNYNDHQKSFFVFRSDNLEHCERVTIHSSKSYLSKISFKLDSSWYNIKPFDSELRLFDNHDFQQEFYNCVKELIVKYYKSGNFTNQIIESVQSAITSKLMEYKRTLEDNKRILENAQPITSNDTHWSDYIMYLLKWSSEHADKEYAGMSPACYDEWLDNEKGE